MTQMTQITRMNEPENDGEIETTYNNDDKHDEHEPHTTPRYCEHS